jgi:methanol--5-hydroxybenzimidazolylcobamide Co-methyltransferase
MTGDLRTMVFALGVLAPRDMKFLWTEIVADCRAQNIVPAGDTACGFANTALALAEQKLLPRIFAALVRVASVPRGLVAYECGATGPGKDCGYENVYMKAIAGVPISMEGRTAACAHLSSMGNIAEAVCDCWSNESVQNVRLLSAQAPVVSVEQLAYDCRLLNTAARSPHGAQTMRDWLVASDASRDPQAFVLRPDVALKIAGEIVQEPTPYLRTRRAVLAAIVLIREAHKSGDLAVQPHETRWMDRLAKVADGLPEAEDAFTAEMIDALDASLWIPAEYEL